MRSSSPTAEPAARTFRRARPWLGTLVHLRVDGEEGAATAAIEDAFAAVGQVHRAMSVHDPGSELSRLNRLAPGEVPEKLSPLLHRVLGAALALAKASGGLFDPTVGGALAASGRLPEDGAAADPEAGWRDVEWLGDGRVRFRRRLRLDLGGIAKGYAVDRALARLRRPGITSAIVNAGGDLRSFGVQHTVWMRDPAAPGSCLPAVEIENAAVATSGGYFSDDAEASDLIDPTSGARLATVAGDGDASVTVCARRAIWADALTKVVLADPEGCAPLLRRLGASALLLGQDGSRRWVA